MKSYGCIIAATFLMMSGIACRSHDSLPSRSVLNGMGQVELLLKAASNGDRDKLHDLVASGIDIDAMGGFNGGTALYDAVFIDDVNAVSLLLEYGADANKSTEDGRMPLHAATASDSVHGFKMIQMLIAYGANVNAKIKNDVVSAGCYDPSEGQTPLHHAAGTLICNEEDFEDRSNITAVKFLLAHGANVNAKDANGHTPLWDAMFWPSLDVMELLIEHGADVNIKNTRDGGTMLHDAAYYGWLDVVQLLLANGANVHSRNCDGETPLHRAALGRNLDIVSFLLNHGADIHAASKRNETPQVFLDEPNDLEPIFLSGNTQTYAIIVTDGLCVRRKLISESVDYDTLWFPNNTHVEALNAAFKSWITQGKYKCHQGYIDPKYILEHLEQYNSEYAGFIKDGTKYIISNKVPQSLSNPIKSPPKNRFSGIMDGGCAQIVFVFNVHAKEITWSRCNGM